MSLLLGIDTGGTYTDAVLFEDSGPKPGVVAKAKALTTREDLANGIGAAVDQVLSGHAARAGEIALVSLSTTLATNTLVEGQGGRVALVFIGFGKEDVERAGLREALAGDPVIQLTGGHTPMGEVQAPLDGDGLRAALEGIGTAIEGVAVVAHFGVRNPSHEIEARRIIREATGLPVTCGHELSAELNGPKRAVTCVLNARLVGMISELVDAMEASLRVRGIDAPLMLVRGDGSLVLSAFARTRPIETILSGPAASLVGAAHLTGRTDAIISDIGGTTTDIAVLRGGRPQLNQNGAVVGGYRTMVQAVDMATHGLGGDSEVWFDDRERANEPRIGPRRLIPVSLLARDYPDVVGAALEWQAGRETPGEFDGRFLTVNRKRVDRVAGLRDAERRLLEAIGPGAVAQDEVIGRRIRIGALNRLVALGLVRVSGFTPSDAAHVTGLHQDWDRDAALRAAGLLARQRSAFGDTRAASGAELAAKVVQQVKRRSAEIMLASALREDGLGDIDPAASKLVGAAWNGGGTAARIDIGVRLPVIGLGASARVYYPDVDEKLGTEAVIPEHAEVANAVGAVVGRVEIRRELTILATEEGGFRVPGPRETRDFPTLATARENAVGQLRDQVTAEARSAGAEDLEFQERFDEKVAKISGNPVFIEARVMITATGRPRLREIIADTRPEMSGEAIDRLLRELQGQVVRNGGAGNWLVIHSLCRRMQMIRPEASAPLRNFAVAVAKAHGPVNARRYFGRAVLVAVSSASIIHDLALNERRARNGHSAFQWCRRALCLAPENIDYNLTAGAIAFDVPDLEGAGRLFMKARAIRPDNAAALSCITEVLTRKGHHDLTARAARRWMCADPAALGAGAALTAAWTPIGRTSGAIRVGRRSLILEPLDGKLYGTLARAQLKAAQLENAILNARRYALISPRNGVALLTLSEASVEREDLSLCETASAWLRVVSSDRGRGIAYGVENSGRPAVYLHIPKTAGSSVQRSTYSFSTTIGHRWIEYEPTEADWYYSVWVAPNLLIKKETLDKRFVFSNTRHLLPLLVSFYEHCRRGFASPTMIGLLRAARSEPFGDFVQRIAAQETPWISRRFIFAAYFERSTGCFLPHWLNRSESVEQDLTEMCRVRRFRYRGVATMNKEVDKDWREYYDEGLIDLVWRTWPREVALFGYARDGGYTGGAMLHRNVSRFRARLTYDWRDDTLRLDGRIFDGRDAESGSMAAGR